MNKILIKIITHAALLTSTLSCAGTMGELAIATPCSGLYIAGDLGAAGLASKESHNFIPETHQLGAAGILGGGYVGYEYWVNNYGLALEVFADATGLNSAITHQPYTYQNQQTYDIGVRALPKHAFTPLTTGHIILGYINGRFNIADNGVYGYVNNAFNLSGFQTGVGFTTVVKGNLSLRVDGIYDIYSGQTSYGQGLESNTTQGYTNTFSTVAGELSLIYKFS